MNEKQKRHIQTVQRRASLSLIAGIATILFGSLGILLLFASLVAAVILLVIAVACMAYLVHSRGVAAREAKETAPEPVTFHTGTALAFEEVVRIFEGLTDEEDRLSLSDDVRFFRFKNMLQWRAILYRTTAFDKQEFDRVKDRLNKKANKEFEISQWVDRSTARKRMRLNLLYADVSNDALRMLLSQNANHNLRRVEGIITVAIVGDTMWIPPLYGTCDLAEIRRYKRVIRFIHQVLLNT